MTNAMIITTLLAIINFLSLIIIGGLAYVLKGLIADQKKMREELTVLQTEHRLCLVCHHEQMQNL